MRDQELRVIIDTAHDFRGYNAKVDSYNQLLRQATVLTPEEELFKADMELRAKALMKFRRLLLKNTTTVPTVVSQERFEALTHGDRRWLARLVRSYCPKCQLPLYMSSYVR